jgi:hypothetical protein
MLTASELVTQSAVSIVLMNDDEVMVTLGDDSMRTAPPHPVALLLMNDNAVMLTLGEE